MPYIGRPRRQHFLFPFSFPSLPRRPRRGLGWCLDLGMRASHKPLPSSPFSFARAAETTDHPDHAPISGGRPRTLVCPLPFPPHRRECWPRSVGSRTERLAKISPLSSLPSSPLRPPPPPGCRPTGHTSGVLTVLDQQAPVVFFPCRAVQR